MLKMYTYRICMYTYRIHTYKKELTQKRIAKEESKEKSYMCYRR